MLDAVAVSVGTSVAVLDGVAVSVAVSSRGDWSATPFGSVAVALAVTVSVGILVAVTGTPWMQFGA